MSRTPAELARELAAARARLPQAKQELRDIPGIRDVLVGLKTRGGQATEDVVFQVYVETKMPLQQLAPEHRIPPVVAGLPTDVMPLSGIRAEQVHAGGLRITQSACGASYGTLGAVALTTQAIGDLPSGSPVFLTNWHVAEVLVAMASVLQREGSHELRAAITEHYLSALQFVPGCDSFDEFSARTRRLLPGRPHGRRRMLT